MKALDEYFAIQKRIHDYFGYVEDWRVIPLADAREFYWWCSAGLVGFAETVGDLAAEQGSYCEAHALNMSEQWVYEANDYTLVCVDTRSDGNALLMVFTNEHRFDRRHELDAELDLFESIRHSAGTAGQ